MTDNRSQDVTRLLQQMDAGDKSAVDLLIPLVYAELREIAASYLRSEREGHTLQPTALVNEAYMKLVAQRDVHWTGRQHFLGIAAQAMRRILVDHARRRNSAKRSGTLNVVDIDEANVAEPQAPVDVIELNDALGRLAEFDERQARIVEFRFFAGLGVEDTATLLEISPATVKREWRAARAWLRRELVDDGGVG